MNTPDVKVADGWVSPIYRRDLTLAERIAELEARRQTCDHVGFPREFTWSSPPPIGFGAELRCMNCGVELDEDTAPYKDEFERIWGFRVAER